MAADGRGGGMLRKEAGGKQGEENDGGHDDDGDDNSQRGLTALAHTFLLTLVVLNAGLRQFLALVLFTGCTHLGIIPLIVRCTGRARS